MFDWLECSATIASAAASSVVNVPRAVSAGSGAGMTRATTLVTTPRVPSEPTTSPVRSGPTELFAVRRPVVMISPPGSTTRSPRMESAVTPYLTQHRPPAFVATLPPIELDAADAGSGG